MSAADLDSDEKVTLFDTEVGVSSPLSFIHLMLAYKPAILQFSLYCQLARMVMYENGIKFESHYVDLPNGEQLNPWYARINPKMIIPAVEIDGDEIINDSRNIMEHFDDNCPASQEKRVEEIMDICYSCDLGWLSTVAMKKHTWLWKLIQESVSREPRSYQ